MSKSLVDQFKYIVKHWWLSVIIGVVFVIVSLLLMFKPIEGYEALTIVFSVCMLLTGIWNVYYSIASRTWLSGWGWYLAGGIINLLLGIVLVASPLITAAIIPYVLAFWILFGGFMALGLSMDLSQLKVKGWGWYLVYAILLIISAALILFNPAAGAVAAVFILAFSFMFMGIYQIMLGFDLRSLSKNVDELKKDISDLSAATK